MKLYITDNLCPAYTAIDRKKAGIINKLWTFNGIVNVKFTDNYYEKPYKVLHINDIKSYDNDIYEEDNKIDEEQEIILEQ